MKVALLGEREEASTAGAVLGAFCNGGRVASPAQTPQTGYVIEIACRGRSERALLVPRDEGSGPSPDSMYRYVCSHFHLGPASIHEDVAKLDGGDMHEWDGRAARGERYWCPSFAPDTSLTIEVVCAELRAFPEPFGSSLAAAVPHRGRNARPVGLDALLAAKLATNPSFGGNERYASQMVFERYMRMPGVIRTLLEPDVRVASKVTMRFTVGKALSYIKQGRRHCQTACRNTTSCTASPDQVFNQDLLPAAS